ncbi:MAG: hypothetical protein PVSMB7_26320 [Chloroflexota bacterium]
MPGLHLSKLQAQRLWHLDTECCQALLDALESARYLTHTATGAYVRGNDVSGIQCRRRTP